jgi:hypothetical protein
MSRIDFLKTQHKLTDKEEAFLVEVDPQGKTWLWLIRGIRQPGFCKNPKQIVEAIDKFNRLRVSPKFKAAGYSADLTHYTWSKLQEVIEKSAELRSNKQTIKQYVGATHLMTYGDFEIYKTEGGANAQAVVQLGSGSSWCTNSGLETAVNYLSTGPIYNVMFRDRPYAQFSPSRYQFNDPRNGTFLQKKGKQTILRNPKLHFLMAELAHNDEAVKNMISNLLVVKQPDFDYIYTVEEPKHVNLEHAQKFLNRCLDKDLAAIDWFLRNGHDAVLNWAVSDDMKVSKPYVFSIARAILDERVAS